MRAKLILVGFVLVFAGATWDDPPLGLLLLLLLPVIALPALRGTTAGLEWQERRREWLAAIDLETRCLAELRRDVEVLRYDLENLE